MEAQVDILICRGAAFKAVAEGGSTINSKHHMAFVFQTLFHQLSGGCCKKFDMACVSWIPNLFYCALEILKQCTVKTNKF